MSLQHKILGAFQKLGKALMTPVATLPAAALMLRLGQPDVLNWPWMATAGGAIFDNLALIFAIGIAIGLAEENNGVAGLAAAVGYLVLTKVATAFDPHINMGVLAGIVSGILAGWVYNKYRHTKLPDFLGFFSGRRAVPIMMSFYSLILGVIAGYGWPLIQKFIDGIGTFIVSSGSLGAFIFGFLNRLLIPVGLHHVLNTLVWFQFGSFTQANGTVVHGDLTRFFAGDPNAGQFMTGMFPIMMFALPAACLAMITAAKPQNRKKVSGMLLGIGLTAFLTGITEPVEFTFMFLAPGLYVCHALLTGTSMALTWFMGCKDGFGFSAGFIDYALNFGIATKPLLLALIGLIFGVVYYLLFLFVIKKWDLATPGRFDDEEEESDELASAASDDPDGVAAAMLEAVGGKGNIKSIDACITRLRLVLANPDIVDEKRLKQLGAKGVIKLGGGSVQVIVGTIADTMAGQMRILVKK
ncbi:MAG: N-acetylglucosamine-specific PTS transporter subunit IIBC [Bacillota bacterium]